MGELADRVLRLGAMIPDPTLVEPNQDFRDHYNRGLALKAAARRKGLKFIPDTRRNLVAQVPTGKYGSPVSPGMTTTKHKKTIKLYKPGMREQILKPGRFSAKLGNRVQVGWLHGAHIYSLTLIERRTCPRSCPVWTTCYGNGMHRAHRWEWTRDLMDGIDAELKKLCKRKKILLRLHVLGDFKDIDALRFWSLMLAKYDTLHIFGFTAHKPDSPLGTHIVTMRDQLFPNRFMIRHSGEAGTWGSTIYEGLLDESGLYTEEGYAIICPAERTGACGGKARSCASCGLCWKVPNEILFFAHGEGK